MLTFLKISTYILVFVGILLITWTDKVLSINILIGFICCGIAYILNFIKLVIE